MNESCKISSFAKVVNRKNKNLESKADVYSVTKYDGFVRSLDYFKKQVFSRDLSTYKVVRKGEFAYSTIHIDEGAIAFLDEEEALISPMYTVFKIDESIDPLYLIQLLTSDVLISKYKVIGQGSLNRRKSVSFSNFGELMIRVPPKKDQQKIAGILLEIDNFLKKIIKDIECTQNLRKGLLDNLLNYGISNVDYKINNLNSIQSEWQVKKIKSVASFRRGSFPQPYGKPEWYEDNGHPFVQVFDIDENYKLKSKTKSRISELAASKSVFAPKGSVLVSIQGTIGRVAITQYDAYVDRTILLFNNFEKYFDKRYFAIVIKKIFSKQGQIANGEIIKTITKETLKEFQVNIPSIREQKRIAEISFLLEESISAKQKYFDKINTLKRSLLQEFIKGSSEEHD